MPWHSGKHFGYESQLAMLADYNTPKAAIKKMGFPVYHNLHSFHFY